MAVAHVAHEATGLNNNFGAEPTSPVTGNSVIRKKRIVKKKKASIGMQEEVMEAQLKMMQQQVELMGGAGLSDEMVAQQQVMLASIEAMKEQLKAMQQQQQQQIDTAFSFSPQLSATASPSGSPTHAAPSPFHGFTRQQTNDSLAAPSSPGMLPSVVPAASLEALPPATGDRKKRVVKKKKTSSIASPNLTCAASPTTEPVASPCTVPAASPLPVHSNQAAINPAFMSFPTSTPSLTSPTSQQCDTDSPLPSQGSRRNLRLQPVLSEPCDAAAAAAACDATADMFAGMSVGKKSTPSGSPCSSVSPCPFPNFSRMPSGLAAAREGNRNSICSVTSCMSPVASERSMSPLATEKKRPKKVVRKRATPSLTSPVAAAPEDANAEASCLDGAEKFKEKMSQKGVVQGLWLARGKQIEVIGTEVHFLKSGKKVQIKEYSSGIIELHGVKLDKAARDGSELVWCDGDVWARSSREGTYEPISLSMIGN